MGLNIHMPSVSISASTSSASAALPAGSGKYLRITNNSANNIAYVNAGGSSVAATNTNLPVNAYETIIVERDPTTDTYVAAIMSASTATITFVVTGTDY